MPVEAPSVEKLIDMYTRMWRIRLFEEQAEYATWIALLHHVRNSKAYFLDALGAQKRCTEAWSTQPLLCLMGANLRTTPGCQGHVVE